MDDIKNISHHLQNQLHQGTSEQKIFPRDNEAQFGKKLSQKISEKFENGKAQKMLKKIEAFCKNRDAKQKPLEKSQGMER